jgi:predicted nucleotidyltransferase
MKVDLNCEMILGVLQSSVPNLLAVYAFGSLIQKTASPNSELDLAVLVAGYADPLTLFNVASQLADLVFCDVDLLDLRAASTVMQYQIITTGQRWWSSDVQAALYETFILSEKVELDCARQALLRDIEQTGSVYGR